MSTYYPPGRSVPYQVPDPENTPDVPRDFRRFADQQWNWIAQAAQAEVAGQGQCHPGQGAVSIVSVNHNFAAGSLLLCSASCVIGTVAGVIGYYSMRQNGWWISPQYSIQGAPYNSTFPIQCLLISTGPSNISMNVECAVGAIAVDWRYINVQCLAKG